MFDTFGTAVTGSIYLHQQVDIFDSPQLCWRWIYTMGCYYDFFFLLIHRSYADGESIQLAVIIIIIIIITSLL